MSGGASKKAASADFRIKRPKILYQVTTLLVVVLIASGLATFFIIRGSQDRLIDKSIEKLLENDAENVHSTFNYIATLLAPEFEERFRDTSEQEFVKALLNEQLTEVQKLTNSELQKMVDDKLLGVETIMVILPPSELLNEPLVFACNDGSLVYTWEVPGYLVDAIEGGAPFLWMEDGISELDLKGEYLIVVGELEGEGTGDEDGAGGVGIAAIIPVHEEIAAINQFYGSERRTTNAILAAVVVGSIFIVILIAFFVLSYLIRKRITEPIDELSAAAEEVMKGNFDVEIGVREGEEFEGLKRAFKEMVESFRKYIAKSVGEE